MNVSPTLGSLGPTPEKLHARLEQAGGLITGVGATLSVGSTIVTVCGGGRRGAPLVARGQRHRVGVRRGVRPGGQRAGAGAVAEVPRVRQRRGVLVGRAATVVGADVLVARRSVKFATGAVLPGGCVTVDVALGGHASPGRGGRSPAPAPCRRPEARPAWCRRSSTRRARAVEERRAPARVGAREGPARAHVVTRRVHDADLDRAAWPGRPRPGR